jgi:hypothetical protein
VLDVLKLYRNVDVIRRGAWKKAFQKLLQLRSVGIFELMIKHISRDTYFKSKPVVYHHQIVDLYLSSLRAKTQMVLRKIATERRTKQVQDSLVFLFGSTEVEAALNYAEKSNLIFRKMGMTGFTHVLLVNYIMAFLKDVFKKDIGNLINLLLIKTKWSVNANSLRLSDAYHQLMRLADQLRVFDESLGENEEDGQKLRNLFYKANKDKSLLPVIRRELMEINDRAERIIKETLANLVLLAKSLQQVYQDYSKKPHELVVNWREVESAMGGRVKVKLTSVYKRVFHFVQLVRISSAKTPVSSAKSSESASEDVT